MIKGGLIEEVENMYIALINEKKLAQSKAKAEAEAPIVHMDKQETSSAAVELDVERGICQSLGFKEFLPFLQRNFPVISELGLTT